MNFIFLFIIPRLNNIFCSVFINKEIVNEDPSLKKKKWAIYIKKKVVYIRDNDGKPGQSVTRHTVCPPSIRQKVAARTRPEVKVAYSVRLFGRSTMTCNSPWTCVYPWNFAVSNSVTTIRVLHTYNVNRSPSPRLDHDALLPNTVCKNKLNFTAAQVYRNYRHTLIGWDRLERLPSSGLMFWKQ